jgi:tetratricopeptide (TPR) repeat protein
MKTCVIVLALLVSLAFPILADDQGHGEELFAEQLGTVHFPVSCAEQVLKPFEHGVALLHSFWYEEAEKEFEGISRQDPECAMAYWGQTMSLWHQLWNKPDAATIRSADELLAKAEEAKPKTDRERDYIAALRTFYRDSGKLDHQTRATAYSQAMEKIYQKYPDDREAGAFYALSLLASEPDNDTTFRNRKKAAEVLEKLFAIEPDHPGVAHYLIHSYDKPQLAQLGLPAARRYAKIAPSAPHALHMPSHIFARLGLWQDDIDSNLASIAATRKSAAMHMGGEGHQFHAMDFLVYAYLQNGHEADAQRLIDDVKGMPEVKDMYGAGFDPRTVALTVFPARYALELHHWSEAAALAPVKNASGGDPAITYSARAIGAVHVGNLRQAHQDVDQINKIHNRLLAAKKKSPADAVEQDRQIALAWIRHAEGKDKRAIQSLRAMAEKEDATGDRTDEGIPIREMLADLLLESKRPGQALVEYETDLKFNPNRFNALYGAARAAEDAGQSQKASEYYVQLLKLCEGSASDRPELARAKKLLAKK